MNEDSLANELYNPKNARCRDRFHGWCPDCRTVLNGSYGHKPDCIHHDVGDLEVYVDRIKKSQERSDKNQLRFLKQLQAMHGKLAILRHENNKLRKANEKLRSTS